MALPYQSFQDFRLGRMGLSAIFFKGDSSEETKSVKQYNPSCASLLCHIYMYIYMLCHIKSISKSKNNKLSLPVQCGVCNSFLFSFFFSFQASTKK